MLTFNLSYILLISLAWQIPNHCVPITLSPCFEFLEPVNFSIRNSWLMKGISSWHGVFNVRASQNDTKVNRAIVSAPAPFECRDLSPIDLPRSKYLQATQGNRKRTRIGWSFRDWHTPADAHLRGEKHSGSFMTAAPMFGSSHTNRANNLKSARTHML